MRTYDYVMEYVIEIQEMYSYIPNGEVELMDMLRAATSLLNHPTDELNDGVDAVYHGQLLGLEFVNYLQPDDEVPYKTGFSKSFLDVQTGLSKLTSHTFEPQELQRARLAQSMFEDLSAPMVENGLNPIYEEFGKKATSKLSDEIAHQELAMMGFRLVVTEALKPAFKPKLVEQILLRFDKHHVPSVEEIIDTLGTEEAMHFVAWETISHHAKVLYGKYDQIKTDENVQQQLTEFNEKQELFLPNDLLTIDGNFFAVPNDDIPFKYPAGTEIRGIFGGIHMVRVPTNAQLLRVIEAQGDDETINEEDREYEDMEASPAIRVLSPMYVAENDVGESFSEPSSDDWIDIPLNYTGTTYRRIKADQVEPEA